MLNDKRNIVSIAAAVTLALTGCSSGPNDGDMKAALMKQTGRSKQIEEMFKDLKVHSCEKAGEAYKCIWTGGPTSGGTGRFVKASDGWTYVGP